MGIDFSHGKASWSYSGFNAFREKLAKEIGIDLRKMDGFTLFSDPTVAGISWDTVEDPIKDLLSHSDCDGELTVEQMKVIRPRLIELVENWEEGYDRERALLLADGMQEAINVNEPLNFQ